jgi:hypothetical protein
MGDNPCCGASPFELTSLLRGKPCVSVVCLSFGVKLRNGQCCYDQHKCMSNISILFL